MNKLYKCCQTGLLLIASVTALQAQTPFPTSSTNYVYVGAAGYNASANTSQIYTASDPGAANFTFLTDITGTAQKINGVGLSQQDGFLYAISFPNSAAVSDAIFYRIGMEGAALQVGVIPGPTYSGATLRYINTTAGIVDGVDHYFFTAYTYTGDPSVIPYTIDHLQFFLGEVDGLSALPAGTDTLPVTYHQVYFDNDTAVQKAFQSFLTNFNYANPGASDGGAEDLAINPADGKFYTYISYPDPSNPDSLLHRPAVINAATSQLNVVGTTVNSSPNREIAGAYFDPGGNFYVLFTDGQYSQVDLNTGALMGLIATSLPLEDCNLRGDLASNFLITPLPVTLEYFTGKATVAGNELSWRSGSESPNTFFQLQRSMNGQDFENINRINARESNSSYSYTDKSVTAWYRLMVNSDNKEQYSQVVHLNGAASDRILVYLTATNMDELTVQANGNPITIQILGQDGRIIAAQTSSSTETRMPFQAAPGLYIIRVNDAAGRNLLTQKVMHH